MDISLGYADLIRLFNVDDPRDFAPGLELRDDGVFVASRDDLPAIARGGEKEAVLTEHPTGNLSEPVLALPCHLDSLESFMESNKTQKAASQGGLCVFAPGSRAARITQSRPPAAPWMNRTTTVSNSSSRSSCGWVSQRMRAPR